MDGEHCRILKNNIRVLVKPSYPEIYTCKAQNFKTSGLLISSVSKLVDYQSSSNQLNKNGMIWKIFNEILASFYFT